MWCRKKEKHMNKEMTVNGKSYTIIKYFQVFLSVVPSVFTTTIIRSIFLFQAEPILLSFLLQTHSVLKKIQSGKA